jgi:membrane protease YdiL (CAAX protease family)
MEHTNPLTQLFTRSSDTAWTPRPIAPLPFRRAFILFAVPALVVTLSFHFGRPALQALGESPFKSFQAALAVPMALLFAAALVAYHKIEDRPLTWDAFRARMRLPRLTLKAALQGVGLFLLASLGYSLFTQLGILLIETGLVPVPANIPAMIDPRASFDLAALKSFAGGSLRGQWELVLLVAVTFFFNIVGEELWWRGYILPRQELVHGRATWLVHGLLWAGFHAYKWWDITGLLPVTLLLSFYAQRGKNNWPILIAHGLLNGLLLVLLFAGAAGWI